MTDTPDTLKSVNPASKRLIAMLTNEFVEQRNVLIAEAMQIDGVDPKDGWRLDIEKGEYAKPEAPTP